MENKDCDVQHWRKQLDQQELTAVDIAWFYLERIAKWDQSGPALNSVAELNPDALAIAEARDQDAIRGPLHGIPVMVKDNIDTGDKMHTTAGALALADSYAQVDAPIVARLRGAGAVLLGKTNLTELANFMTDHMPNGYSGRGGQVLNPYGPGRLDTGGSSAGSGVAVAAGLAPLAVGTETSGSILSPASQNSIVGIKPSLGLVSRTGIIPIAHSQDTAGPMTATVRDAALLLGVIAGPDPMDPITLTSPFEEGHDFSQYLNAQGLVGARLGLVGKSYQEDWTESDRLVMAEAVADLRALGAIVDEDVVLPDREGISYEVLIHEFKVGLNAYLRQLGPSAAVHSLAELIQFNLRHEAAALKYGQSILLESDATRGTLLEPRYWKQRQEDLAWSRQNGIDAIMATHQLDALLFYGNYGADIAARAGYPSITVPAGYRQDDGKPIGLTFTGRRFSEPVLLRLAYAYEQGTHRRTAPQLHG